VPVIKKRVKPKARKNLKRLMNKKNVK
jgi:hypothetical protein